jgi:predicted CxxxxCH...CXXCH cytochrome family protein
VIILAVAGLLLLGGVLTAPRQAEALHDQGYICYVCHSLNPAELRTGSNSIRTDQAVLATIPPGGTPWAGGMPVSCDFCHRAATDVPTVNMANKAKKHPVDLIQTGNLNPVNEITCNDCHGNTTLDLVPTSLTSKTPSDGYPNHKNVDNNYTHNLVNNPPHIDNNWPYWGATVPGTSRATDGAFWTSVRTGGTNIVCWRCHDGSSTAPYTTGVRSSKVVKADYIDVAGGSKKGHQITTTGIAGQLTAGSALPCYDCHDSHGSVNNALILDNNSIYNDCTSLLAVTTYNQASRPYNDKVVCAGCHDTNNASTLGTKAGGVATMVEGLYPVDPYNSTATSALHIAGGVATVMTSSTRNCLGANGGCHASPHNPVGESSGGQVCSTCHAEFASMRGTTTYQHAMYDNTIIYPNTVPTSSGTDANRRCLMCHVDHNIFNKSINPSGKGRGGNLRTRIQDNAVSTTLYYDNTDFSFANGGLCISCHSTTAVLTKNTSNQKVGLATTQLVTPTIAAFDNSAHRYAVNTTFNADGTGFAGVCAKCHNTDLGSSFNSLSFSMHNATSGQLLAQFGRTVAADNLEQGFCYGCHSESGDIVGTSGGKGTTGRDWYGASGPVMPSSAEKTYKNFNLGGAGSKHPLSGNHTSTASVECENCHNPHIVRTSAGNRVVNPDNTLALAPYTTTADNVAFCIKCHDGSVPGYVNSATTLVPYAVIIPTADNALMNKTTNQARAHWTVNGSVTAGTVQACSKCHDNHGSTARALLGNYDPAAGNNKIYGTQQTVTLYSSATPTMADNQAVCSACHLNAGGYYPSTTVNAANVATQETYRDGTGYFSVAGQVIRWPGKATWDNTTYSPHNTSAKNAPASLGGRAVGDCNSCHDVHGTPYAYNVLTDNQAAGNYKICFDCHGLAGSTATDNVAKFYPAASAGLGAAASATVNTGHNIKTAGGLLPQYTALPCYDCHVVHGSRNNNTQLKSDQRWSGLGDTKTNAANTRTFCLGCHVASDDAATTGTVENLQRQTAGTNMLKLVTTNPVVEHATASTQSCGACHGARNAYNDNTYGPHNPASGVCDTCHEGQGTRSTVFGFNGSHQHHSDNTTYRLACKACHSWTRPTTPAVHKDNTSAVQYAQVAFDNEAATWSTIQYATATLYEYKSMSINPYGGAILTPSYAGGTDNGTDVRQNTVRWKNGTCSNVWCHSNAMPVGGPSVFDTVQWGGTVTCGVDCHGNDGQSGRARIGDSASVTKGSAVHFKHVASIQCNNCHYYTLTGANNVVTAYDNHVNGVKNIQFAPTIGGTWDCVARTCNGTACHGTNPVPLPKWDNAATVASCFSCHQGAEVLGKPRSDNNAANAVNSTQYSTRGHGRPTASGNYPGTLNPAAHFDNVANDCYFCHSENAAHAPSNDNVNDPYRLNGAGQKAGSAVGNWADNTDGLCLKCHGTTADRSGVTVGLPTSAYNDNTHDILHAKVGVPVWTFAPKCVDCHDPHGDTNNAMIRSGINAPTAVGDNSATGAGSNSKGTPNRATPIAAVTFTDNTGFAANSYAIPGATTYGICEVCHVQTTLVTLYSRGFDNTGSHASNTGNCISCHGHGSGFKGAGHSVGANCKGCHATAQGTRRAIQVEFDNTAQHGGTWAQITSADCEKCHYEVAMGDAPQLKVWTTTTDPAATGAVSYVAATPSSANAACIGCHKGAASGAKFSVGPTAANVDQYWSTGTTTYNSHANTPGTSVLTVPIMAKVRNPHGYPTTNKLKQEVWTTPVNQTKYTDAAPVGCLECHPAHGNGGAPSYGAVSPAQLKGKAFADNITGGVMLVENEPALCWTCHDTATVGVKDYWGDTTTAGTHWSGTLKSTFAYKNRAITSTHEVNGAGTGAKCSICHNPHGASTAGVYNSPMLRGTWTTSPYYEDRTGKNNNTTTKPTFSTGMSMTRFGPRGSAGTAFNNAAARGNGYDNGTGTGHDGYYIDENTFGWTGTYANTWLPTALTSKHMVENVANFAGLCANCHTDATQSTSQTGGVAALQTYLASTGGGLITAGKGLTDWGASIHNTVKGWASSGPTSDRVNPANNPRMHGYGMTGSCFCFAYSTNITTSWGTWKGFNWQGVPSTVNHMTGTNAIHQFPCSKCHTPHASDMPRLMTSNCLDVGTSATARKLHGTAAAWTYPAMPTMVFSTDNGATLCHGRRRTNTTGGGGWNKVTGW